jgi:hypothetical protein
MLIDSQADKESRKNQTYSRFWLHPSNHFDRFQIEIKERQLLFYSIEKRSDRLNPSLDPAYSLVLDID